MDQRLREFDIMRAFAALSVIAIHVTAGFAQSNLLAYLWNQGMRYAVPLFVILSGFLLYFVDLGRPRMSYTGFLQKRCKKILLPYVLWTILYTLYSSRKEWSAWLAGDWVSPLSHAVKHLLKGTGYVHLYFLLIILQLYFLYPLLRTWLEKRAAWLVLGSGALTLFAQTMIYLHQLGVIVLPGIGIPYVSLFPLWLFYFVFGMYAAREKEHWQERLAGRAVSLGILWLLSFAVLTVDSQLTLTQASSIKPSVMLYCFTSFFFFYALALQLKQTAKRWGRWLDWLAVHSFMIFLLHPLLLSILVVSAGKIPLLTRLWSGTGGMVLLYAATTVCTAILTHFLSMTKLSVWIGGVYNGKSRKQTVLANS
ncbi:acyltransferase [Brevibacillus sp. H7]|uniref:acyltransferase n=1 Tax=Brevibacillus sp. H7 TaxID=3349138 RepID=UPI003800BCAE